MVIEVKVDDILSRKRSEKIDLFSDKSLNAFLKKTSVLSRTLVIKNSNEKESVYVRVESSKGDILVDYMFLPTQSFISVNKMKCLYDITFEFLANFDKLLFIFSKKHPLQKELEKAQSDLYIERMKRIPILTPIPTPYIPNEPPKPQQPWAPDPRHPYNPWDTPRFPDTLAPGGWPLGKLIWQGTCRDHI